MCLSTIHLSTNPSDENRHCLHFTWEDTGSPKKKNVPYSGFDEEKVEEMGWSPQESALCPI